MKITPEDTKHVGIFLITPWRTDGDVHIIYSLFAWQQERRAPRVLEFPKIVKYMGKQRKVAWVSLSIDRVYLSESKRIKVRVPEGVEVFFHDCPKKFFDIETY